MHSSTRRARAAHGAERWTPGAVWFAASACWACTKASCRATMSLRAKREGSLGEGLRAAAARVRRCACGAPACVLSLVRSILHTASSRVKARRLCWAIDGACVVAGRVDAADRREAGRCIIRRGAMRVREQGRRRRRAIASALMSTGARRHRCARTRSHRHAEVEQVFERSRARSGRRPEGPRPRITGQVLEPQPET